MLTRLASGGMAAIYVARAIGVAGFERLFAIKVLHSHLAYEQEFVAMFLDEARLAARIRHPNVISTFEVQDTGDAGYYLVMEYVEGDHLGALMREAAKARRRLPASVTLRIIVDALNGLSAAHDLTDESGEPLHLVHRDISPQNIMVSTDGISRLTDFGVAKAATRISNTRDGQFKGKLAYMAPEHASDGKADQRSDLFAMGTILWECLTGQRLFRADNHAATLTKVCLDPIPMPSAVDQDLAPFDTVLEKALERDPEKRFQSASDFIDAIEENASEMGSIAKARAISNLVRQYATEKLQKDRDLIKSAIAAIESKNFVPNADEGEQSLQPQPSAPLISVPPQNVPQEAATSEGKFLAPAPAPMPAEALYEPPAPPGTNRMLWVLVSIGLAISAGIGLAFALAGSEYPTQITTSPIETKPSEDETVTPGSAGSEQPVWRKGEQESVPEPTAKEPEQKPSDTAQAEPIATEKQAEPAATEKQAKPVAPKRRSSNGRRPRRKTSGVTPVSPKQKPTVPKAKSTTPLVKPATRPSAKPPKRPKPSVGDDLIKNPYR